MEGRENARMVSEQTAMVKDPGRRKDPDREGGHLLLDDPSTGSNLLRTKNGG